MKGTTNIRTTIAVTLTAAASIALAGCAPAQTDDADTLTIVASTDVYGDIAASIAGDRATVTSIITGTAQDPHSYEATARDQLALSRADLIIENGGGFDPFIDTLLAGLDSSAPVLTATEISGLFDEDDHGDADDHGNTDRHGDTDGHEGHDHSDGVNEHVWYSFEAMGALAAEIAHSLEEIDPEGADEYAANYAEFSGEIDGLLERAHEIGAAHAGAAVAVTEAAPLLLFNEIGLVNKTPAEFSTAVENGTDVAPAVLLQMRSLIEAGEVALLAYNEQTSGVETEQLVSLARDSDVAVVAIAETIPDGLNYVSWMDENLDNIEAALG
ncbi:metal ABC transporter solute-binding protein, Zn/Mn family [Salinibacterium hongtaonis]|uniref:ABC transporter substrate-binding protein n=1 Tax=Homoserinimonas hongtaonis TaxID=2079791 RepID=A0A2U1T1U7_9MICO|nr:zinc ABC transporter substrate-binding protein [Salinibacterium hongtaonis]PWB97854.1 ABC transporter substrate-binding protein [Salinibacterium hongtaonis]